METLVTKSRNINKTDTSTDIIDKGSTMSERSNKLEDAPSLRIKDLMLGELLCQSGVLSDSRLFQLTKIARAAQGSLGYALVYSNVLTASELFVARRLVNRYLRDSDNPEQYIGEMRKHLHKQVQKQSATALRSSLSLAKITRKHMATDEALFLVS
jgi:hypothetical protein